MGSNRQLYILHDGVMAMVNIKRNY